MANRTLKGARLEATELPPFEPISRAVKRPIEPGTMVVCKACDEPLKFVAVRKLHQIICNVYVDKKWVDVEHYHPACYDELGQPHGAILSTVLAPSRPQAGRGSTASVG